jgi:hypothetical protein
MGPKAPNMRVVEIEGCRMDKNQDLEVQAYSPTEKKNLVFLH